MTLLQHGELVSLYCGCVCVLVCWVLIIVGSLCGKVIKGMKIAVGIFREAVKLPLNYYPFLLFDGVKMV